MDAPGTRENVDAFFLAFAKSATRKLGADGNCALRALGWYAAASHVLRTDGKSIDDRRYPNRVRSGEPCFGVWLRFEPAHPDRDGRIRQRRGRRFGERHARRGWIEWQPRRYRRVVEHHRLWWSRRCRGCCWGRRGQRVRGLG